MINSLKFTERLQKVIEFYGETASGFAEKIGVQRSSISHILSGEHDEIILRAGSTLNQGPRDESFGIDDVYIWVR